MELFNKYKNKDFTYITNYINSCINDDSLTLTPEQLKEELLGTSQNTFEEFINALLNKNTEGLDAKSPNAELLYLSNEKMMPIRENYVPIRTSFAERSWLYYILQDSKSSFFITEELRHQLISILDKGIAYPITDDYIDVRKLSTTESTRPNAESIDSFKKIVSAISEHKHLTLTNKSFSSKIYENQTVIPYKLEYAPQFDSFSLSAYPLDTKRPVKMNLANISNVKIGDIVENYDSFVNQFEKMLTQTRVKKPITIEISNDRNGYDRCSYKFSSFDRVCYENEKGDLVMKIYYYRFQKDEFLRNVLFLGPSVKIVSPSDIVDEYIELLKNSLQNYEAEE